MTIFKKIAHASSFSKNKRFQFNWQAIIDNKHWTTYEMIASSMLVGLIAISLKTNYIFIEDLEVSLKLRHHRLGSTLVAFACWLSFQNNDDGYVSLFTKTNGTENFYKKLGATFISLQNCYFSTDSAKRLIKKYSPKGGFKVEK